MLKVEIAVTIWSLNHGEDDNWFHESGATLLESSRLSSAMEMRRHLAIHRNLGARVMTQCLRVYTALPADQSSVHSTHIRELTLSINSSKTEWKTFSGIQAHLITSSTGCPCLIPHGLWMQPTVFTRALESDFLLALFSWFSS